MRIYVYVIDQQKQYMNKNEKKNKRKCRTEMVQLHILFKFDSENAMNKSYTYTVYTPKPTKIPTINC